MYRTSLDRVLVIAATFAVGAATLTPAAVAAHERPFKARSAGNAHLSDTDVPWIKRNDETAEGKATHLGRFTWVSVEYVDFHTIPGGVAVEGSFTMTAANGDRLFGEYTTTGFPDEAGDLIIHGNYQFTGGTGRFAGATGSGDIDAIASLAPGLPFTGTMNGTIEY